MYCVSIEDEHFEQQDSLMYENGYWIRKNVE